MMLIALALAEIKPVYYPGEERLVSLDVLKLYGGEGVICQNPEDIDLDGWLDEGELTEIPKIPLEEVQKRVREPSEDLRGPELYPEPDLGIPILLEDPKVIAERESIYKRIQSEIQHKDNEAEVAVEEMLEVPPAWNEVPDLMMEDKDAMMITEADTKQ